MQKICVDYENESGDKLTMSTDGTSSDYFITAIDGLYGYTNDVHTVQQSEQDGATFIGGQVSARRISISLKLAGDVAQNRNALISTITPKQTGIITIRRGQRERSLKCVPEKIAVNTTDGSVLSVVVLCPNPFWMEDEKRTQIAAWLKKFMYPLTIERGTGFVFGERKEARVITVENNGNVEIGMRVVMTASADVVNPMVANARNESEFMRFLGTLHAGDMLTIHTGTGEKQVAIKRAEAAEEENAFASFDTEGTFMQLKTGKNLMTYAAEVGENALTVTVFYYPRFLEV